jgi:hypothetical protein
MNPTKRIIKYQNKEVKKFLTGFWLIMLAINIFGYMVNYYIGKNSRMFYFSLGDDGTMSVAGINIMAAFYALIGYGIAMYYEHFPIAVGFSVTRKDFYKSVIINNCINSFFIATISALLLKIDRFIINAMGREPLVDFRFFNTADDNILFIIFSLFIGFFTLLSLVNIIGVLLYKLGAAKFWIGTLVLFIFIFIFMSANDFIILKTIENSIRQIFITRITPNSLIYIIIINFIFYAFGYFIIKKTNIKYSKS